MDLNAGEVLRDCPAEANSVLTFNGTHGSVMCLINLQILQR